MQNNAKIKNKLEETSLTLRSSNVKQHFSVFLPAKCENF